MEKLFDETHTLEDNSIVSRNIWYGYVELYRDSEYGKEIILDDNLIDIISKIIKSDLSEDIKPFPTETNWYLYGKTLTRDAIDDTIRPTIMIREKKGAFLVHCNISDFDFALNIDKILSFNTALENHLVNILREIHPLTH